MNHTPPLGVDVSDAFYFVTICAAGHRPWTISKIPCDTPADVHDDVGSIGRAGAPSPAATQRLDTIAPLFLQEAREYHIRGIWRLSLFLVMPDHLHCLVHIPNTAVAGRHALPNVVANFKHLMAVRYGLAVQRDFFDTRIRDDAHYAEKWNYIVRNPVVRGLVSSPREWPHVIAFDRMTGEERAHRLFPLSSNPKKICQKIRAGFPNQS